MMMKYALWTIQTLLAILFIFTGGLKLVLPIATMTQQMNMPGAFLRFIGVAEVLGGLGLVLPGLLHIRPRLTSLAAACLTVIMIGATVVTIQTMGLSRAILPVAVGILLIFVAWQRK